MPMTPVWLTDRVTSDLDRALHYTTLWGLEGVVLRTVGTKSDRVPHVDQEKLMRRLREYETIPVAAVQPGMFRGRVDERAMWLDELLRLEELFAFCNRIGCERVLLSAFTQSPDAEMEDLADPLRKAGDRAADAGITLCILNEVDGPIRTGRQLAALLEHVDHTAVQAAWNPAAAVASGEHPHEGLEAVQDQVAFVRLADGMLRGQWEPAPIGEGEVDVFEQIQSLYAGGYAGPLSLQVEIEPRPNYGLRAATRLHEMIRAARS